MRCSSWFSIRDYENFVEMTALKIGHEDKYIFGAMGLASEVGEILDVVKKQIFHSGGNMADAATKENLLLELGDALWYITYLTLVSGVSLKDVIEKNKEKLQARINDRASEAT